MASVKALLALAVCVCAVTVNRAGSTDCYDANDKGKSYTGTQSTTASGRKCQAWAALSPHSHHLNKDSKFPNDDSVKDASNYCRNPDNSREPWCYTADKDKRFEYCGIKKCEANSQAGSSEAGLSQAKSLIASFKTMITDLKSKIDEMIVAERDSRSANEYNFKKITKDIEEKEFESNGGAECDSSNDSKKSGSSTKEESEEKEEEKEEIKSCPEGTVTFEGSCIRIVADKYNWMAANERCQKNGEHLVFIESKEKYDFLVKELKQNREINSNGIWTGATDRDSEGYFKWHPSERYLHSSDFSMWASGQPDDHSGQEDCVQMRKSDYRWNDATCAAQLSFACEIALKDLNKPLQGDEGEVETEQGCAREVYLSHVADTAFTASSSYSKTYYPQRSRLHNTAMGGYQGGWMPRNNDKNPWIQVDLGESKQVVAVATQGLESSSYWTTSYAIRFSDDGKSWTEQLNGGYPFNGNNNKNGVVVNKLKFPFKARYVRIVPRKWRGYSAIRWQLYGPECETCVGKRLIASLKGEGLKASSRWDHRHDVKYSLLHHVANAESIGSWSAKRNDKNQYVQVDLGKVENISAVATQGREEASQYVTSYFLKYSNNAHVWTKYDKGRVFSANYDQNTVVRHSLNPPIKARYVMLVPVSWKSHISLRWELYSPSGCEVAICDKPVPLKSLVASAANEDLSASSILSNNELYYGPRHSRLNTYLRGDTGSWYAGSHDAYQYIQVDLKEPRTVVAVATQGREDYGCYVKYYSLEFSMDGMSWETYVERGSLRLLEGNTHHLKIKRNFLENPFKARFVRLRPKWWYAALGMRWELYSDECEDIPLDFCAKLCNVNCAVMVHASLRHDVCSIKCAEPSLLPNAKITASSCRDDNRCTENSLLGYVNDFANTYAWSPKKSSTNEYIQAEFKEPTKIFAVATMGRSGYNEYIRKYQLLYSQDGEQFEYYMENGRVRTFWANIDYRHVSKHMLNNPITARFVRLHFVQWNSWISVRWALYGSSGCEPDVCYGSAYERPGYVASGKATMSALHTYNSAYDPNKYSKLGSVRSWWTHIRTSRYYIQADLGSSKVITGVATQSMRGTSRYVRGYYLYYSEDNKSWYAYQENGAVRWFKGNDQINRIQVNNFAKPVTARYLRLYATDWYSYIALRWEIYGPGCDECSRPHYLKNLPITAYKAKSGNVAYTRLTDVEGNGGWVPSARRDEWIQADLGSVKNVSGIITRGRNYHGQWVQKYALEYSTDGSKWYKGKEYSANGNQYDPKENTWDDKTFQARYVKLLVKNWRSHIALRWDLLGPQPQCPGN